MNINQLQIFDAHFHIIDKRFPLVENKGYLPVEFKAEDYQRATQRYAVCGGAVVSGSFQAFDQDYLIDALKKLGNKYAGVIQLPVSASDENILSLHQAGVRAVRFNIRRGGSSGIKEMEKLSGRVYALAEWHTEIYIDSKDLAECMPVILKLKKFSIDHLGLSKKGLPFLKKLVEKGGYVKAAGFGRVDFNPIEIIKALTAINPDAVMFGTDLPSTRAPVPFSHQDVLEIVAWFNQETADKIFYKNAQCFYKFD